MMGGVQKYQSSRRVDLQTNKVLTIILCERMQKRMR